MRSVLALAAFLAAPALAQTAFTYQGRLDDAGHPAGGSYDLQFRLWDSASGGSIIGSVLCSDNTIIDADGTFSVSLDFGAVFSSRPRWLEIAVRPDTTAGNCGTGAYTVLAPRQPLTPTPYAQNLVFPVTATTAAPGNSFTLNVSPTLPGGAGFVGVNASNVSDTAGVAGYTSSGSALTSGVAGYTSGIGYGVTGSALSTTGSGVAAINRSPTEPALWAKNFASSGSAPAISAATNSPSGVAIQAGATLPGGAAIAIYGYSNTDTATGIMGIHFPTTGTTAAIAGISYSEAANATAIVGQIASSTPGGNSAAVLGRNDSTTGLGIGVWGRQNGAGYGVYGTTPFGFGVYGAGTGVSGFNVGVYGSTASPDGYAGFFTGRTYVGGSLVHPFTAGGPEQRMTPIAYGGVSAAGLLLQGTSNLTASRAGNIYLITIAGETYQFQSYITVVTPATGTSPVFATTNSAAGQLQVFLWNAAGAATTGDFHFIVYKR